MKTSPKNSRGSTLQKKNTNSSAQYVTVLLSGGIDSAACVAFYVAQKFNVSALFIDHGQKSARKENAAALAVSSHYSIPLAKVKISGLTSQSTGYIIGRNAVLLNVALMALRPSSAIIAMGIHAGTAYPDCSEEFINHMQTLADLYADGRVVIGVPFLKWSKRDIWDYCRIKEVPVDLTYSCELGRRQPCRDCLSCHNLEELYAS
jgi:7-cyano-7-deazaguanine synthase